MTLHQAKDWHVDIAENGRTGSVSYVEPAGRVPFTWEFGGGDTVAILYFHNEAVWRAHHPWATGRREEILQRVAAEVIRQKCPGCYAEIDDKGWINLRQVASAGSPPIALHSRTFRARKAKLAMMLAVFVAAAAIGLKLVKSMFFIQSPTGSPVGLSVRTPQHIATLIQTLEPYVPSLHRNAGNDRYRLSLLLSPLDGTSQVRKILIAQGLNAGEFNLLKLLGWDGKTVWFNFRGVGGLDVKTERLIGAPDLLRANPTLGETWDDSRRLEFERGRLRLTSADRQRIFEVVPETLQAVPAQPLKDRTMLPFAPGPEAFLSSGVRPTPTEWLGVHSLQEAARYYKANSWLARVNPAEDAKVMRRLHRAELGPELDRGNRTILSMTPQSVEEYLNAAFLRATAQSEPLRLTAPDSFLLAYTSRPGLGGTLMLARVDASGKVHWKADTGIDRSKLTQILPDANSVVFTGTRPPVPDKVSEPILVVVDTQSGAASTSSLWK